MLPTSASPIAAEQAVARAVWAALRGFGRIPGASVEDLADATLIRSRTPHANFNNLIAAALAGDTVEERIRELLRAFAPDSLPVTWWVGPTTRPADLGRRLQRLGLAPQEPEFAMALDLAVAWRPSPLPAGATLAWVASEGELDDLLAVMNAAYGWPDPARAALVRDMYVADFRAPEDRRDTHHVLVRLGGRAVACASLFIGGGEAFVTNVGTRPDARGRGLGSAATAATLELARDLGRHVATLAASVDGRPIYRRLGFTEAGVLERWVATSDIVARLDDPGAHHGDRR